jgi:hypothetical protein
MWDTVVESSTQLSHDLPCPRCGHSGHRYLPCDHCGCAGDPVSEASQRNPHAPASV